MAYKRLKIKEVIGFYFWKRFLHQYAKSRFNYDYATRILKFRERGKSNTGKKMGIICYKKGHTKNGFLNGEIKKGNYVFKLPNYTKSKRTITKLNIPSPLLKAFEAGARINELLKISSSLFPYFRGTQLKRFINFLKHNKDKKVEFKWDKSVFEELQTITNKEVLDCARALKHVKIRGEQI